MDAVLFISLALFLTISVIYGKEPVESKNTEVEPEDVTREAKLNEFFYEDQNAFSEIINALGFPK